MNLVSSGSIDPDEAQALARQILESYGTDDMAVKKRVFLAAYTAARGNVKKACEASGIIRSVHNDWLEVDEEYKKRFLNAQADAADIIEAEAVRRAVDGVVKHKFYKGQIIMWPDPSGETEKRIIKVPDPSGARVKGERIVNNHLVEFDEPVMIDEEVEVPKMVPYTEREYSDALLAQLLRGYKPGKYGSNPDGGNGVTNKVYININHGDFGSEIGGEALPADRGGAGSLEIAGS